MTILNRIAGLTLDLVIKALETKKPVVTPAKTPIMLLTRYVKLVGVTFEGRQEIIRGLAADTKFTVRAVPDNPHDKKAVGVFAGDTLVGWVPAKPIHMWNEIPNHLISDKLKAGKVVEVNDWIRTGGFDPGEYGGAPAYWGLKVRFRIQR